jgi:hypothetical protein
MNFKVYKTIATSSGGLKTADATSAANTARVGFSIQNQDDVKLYVKLGTGCSTTSYDYILNASTTTADGTGGMLFLDNYVGPISVKDGAAGTPSYTFTEFLG